MEWEIHYVAEQLEVAQTGYRCMAAKLPVGCRELPILGEWRSAAGRSSWVGEGDDGLCT